MRRISLRKPISRSPSPRVGRAMETVDREALAVAVFPVLLDAKFEARE